jgi:hypothetical protein
MLEAKMLDTNRSQKQVLISPAFYTQLFCTKVCFVAFFYLQFGFENLCKRNIGTKADHKMLVKLTTGGVADVAVGAHPHHVAGRQRGERNVFGVRTGGHKNPEMLQNTFKHV